MRVYIYICDRLGFECFYAVLTANWLGMETRGTHPKMERNQLKVPPPQNQVAKQELTTAVDFFNVRPIQWFLVRSPRSFSQSSTIFEERVTCWQGI